LTRFPASSTTVARAANGSPAVTLATTPLTTTRDAAPGDTDTTTGVDTTAPALAVIAAVPTCSALIVPSRTRTTVESELSPTTAAACRNSPPALLTFALRVAES